MGNWSASTRFRAERYVAPLAARFDGADLFLPDDRPIRRPGITGQARFFSDHGIRYLRQMKKLHGVLSGYEAVYVQRGAYPMGPAIVLAALKSYTGRVVFDLDDATFAMKPVLKSKGPAARWLYGPQQSKFMLDRADAIIVSTPTLADQLPPHIASVTVLPTVPDVTRYRMAPSTVSQKPVTVGWLGTSGGLVYLDPLRQAFTALASSGICELVVVSDRAWSGPARFVPWKMSEQFVYPSTFSIGIMPLIDTAYTRAKAGFKLLEYMAAGIPVVASPVGVNESLIAESGAGILASSPLEWQNALQRLSVDGQLRTEMGLSGRAFVEQYAKIEDHVHVVANLLSTVPQVR